MSTATSDNDTRLPGLPRYIRINTLKTSRSEAAKSLTATGHVPEQQSTYRAARKGDAPAESSNRSYVPDAHVPDLLVFKPKGQSDISRIPLVASFFASDDRIHSLQSPPLAAGSQLQGHIGHERAWLRGWLG